MKIRWNEVQYIPNHVSEQDGRPCPHCQKSVPHEVVEIYAVSDGRLLNVTKIQTSNLTSRIYVDA